MTKAKTILESSDLLIKTECKIVDDTLYERCEFDDDLFVKSEFVNTKDETYYLDDTDHVYRYFTEVDDYDYVTDSETIKKLNAIFK